MVEINLEKLRKWRPPAITTGLVPFTLLLRYLVKFETLQLTPDALFHIDLNRLSFYPLVFANWWQYLGEMAIFLPLCGSFELQNGTVRTGVVLNVVAFIPALLSNIIAKLSNNKVAGASYCGTTSWITALAAFLSVSSWSLPVLPIRSFVITVPGWVLPILGYAVLSVLAPEFMVIHGLALAMGYGLGLLYLDFLVGGTSKPVEWIENKIEVVINFLRYIVHFVGEVEARELRRGSLVARNRAMNADNGIPLPAASLTGATTV